MHRSCRRRGQERFWAFLYRGHPVPFLEVLFLKFLNLVAVQPHFAWHNNGAASWPYSLTGVPSCFMRYFEVMDNSTLLLKLVPSLDKVVAACCDICCFVHYDMILHYSALDITFYSPSITEQMFFSSVLPFHHDFSDLQGHFICDTNSKHANAQILSDHCVQNCLPVLPTRFSHKILASASFLACVLVLIFFRSWACFSVSQSRSMCLSAWVCMSVFS